MHKTWFMLLKDINETEFLASFEASLAKLLAGDRSKLDEIARYCAIGGKRVRPVCVYLGATAAGGNCEVEPVLALAMSIELVHSYSLVHDDLPVMDNDMFRRGKPSAHAAFGEANAILGGDLLLTLAADALADGCAKFGRSFALAAKEITNAALSMAHGQALELAGCHGMDETLAMYSKKTGALISGAFRAGAICAEADETTLSNITEFAKKAGLAFQLCDDLLDGEGVVPVIGREETRLLLTRATSEACEIASALDERLSAFALALRDRKY